MKEADLAARLFAQYLFPEAAERRPVKDDSQRSASHDVAKNV